MIFDKYPQILFYSSNTSDGNMSLVLGDAKKAQKNRIKLFNKLNISPKSVTELTQTHSNKILKVNQPLNKKGTADGLITNKKDLFLLLKTADCMPIAILDPQNQAIALIHAGFKGLESKIIENAVNLLKKNFQSEPKSLVAQIGPSIGPCCYRMDLWTEAEKQLIKLGVLKENIDNSKLCTYYNKQYYSHREAMEKNLPNDHRFITIFGFTK